jgi:hypothetical protein
MATESEDEEDAEPMEHKKRTLLMFLQLPDQDVISGKYVNNILIATFIGDPLVKKPRIGISPANILNPQLISSAIPHTILVSLAAQNVIDIQYYPELDTTAYTTIITEKPPSPPQTPSPLQDTTIQPQPTSLEPMHLDLHDPHENVQEQITLNLEALIQSDTPLVPIHDTLPSMKIQTILIPQVPSTQSPLSIVNVAIPINRSKTPEVFLQKEAEAHTVQKEPKTSSGKSETSLQ